MFGVKADSLHTEHLVRASASKPSGRQQPGRIIPHAVKHSIVLLRMGKKVTRNMLRWLELSINLLLLLLVGFYINYINHARSSKHQTLSLIRYSHVGACEYCLLMEVKMGSVVKIFGQRHGSSMCLRNVRNFRPNQKAWRPRRHTYWSFFFSFFLILAFLQHMAEYMALRSVTESHHVFTA